MKSLKPKEFLVCFRGGIPYCIVFPSHQNSFKLKRGKHVLLTEHRKGDRHISRRTKYAFDSQRFV